MGKYRAKETGWVGNILECIRIAPDKQDLHILSPTISPDP